MMDESDESLRAQEGLQRLVLMHLLEDVAAADEFAVDVELWVGGPVAVDFDFLADDGIVENVDRLILCQTYISQLVPYFLSNSTTKLE
jgi:hypothetical protein